MSEEEWSVATGKRKRNINGGGRGAVLQDGEAALICNIQAKSFELWGNGRIITIRENCKGKCWINSFSIDGGMWLISKLHEILQEGFSFIKQEWSYSCKSEWFLLSRDKNKGGEFLKLSVPDSKGSLHHCFFPMGRNKQGWREFCKTLERCCNFVDKVSPALNVSQQKDIFTSGGLSSNNCWTKSSFMTASKLNDQPNNYLGNWNMALKLVVKALNVDWSEIGGWLQQHMAMKEMFKICPLSFNEAVIFASSLEEKNRLASTGSFKVDEVEIKFCPWSYGKIIFSKNEVSNVWIIISGIPQHTWDLTPFNTIGKACGGLLAISHETRTGEVISEIRLKVKGPISSEEWTLGLVGKEEWVSARVTMAEKQLEHSSGIHRSLVFEPETSSVFSGLEREESLCISRWQQGLPAVISPLDRTFPLLNAQLPLLNIAQVNQSLLVSAQRHNLNLSTVLQIPNQKASSIATGL